jgi:flagellar biosynthetic protein FlhB
VAEDSDQERTEQPTSKRIEKAREQGDVPRSREMATCVMLLIGGSTLWMFTGPLVTSLNRFMVSTMTFEREMAFDPALLFERMSGHFMEVAIACIPVAFLMTLAAVASPLILGGWLFNGSSLEPKFDRLNPIKGIMNLFSLNSLVELGKGILKSVLVGFIAWFAMRTHLDAVLNLSVEPLKVASSHMPNLLWTCFIMMVCAMIAIAAIDVPYQLWNYTRKLKMSRQEVKQEHKESDGDPLIKGKIRALQRAAARRRMMSAVPTADVVVTNPTHFAVALKYSEGGMSAPQVVAKGTEAVAANIRKIAAENNVPILEAPPLARALHYHTEIGDEIPESLYTAVAEVLAYIFQLRTYNSNGGVRPDEPSDLEVPKELDDPLYKRKAAMAAAQAKAAQ